MSSFAAARTRITTNLTSDVRSAALVGVKEVLTEENTDALIERIVPVIKERLPVYLRWIPIGTVLDALLPGALSRVFEDLLA